MQHLPSLLNPSSSPPLPPLQIFSHSGDAVAAGQPHNGRACKYVLNFMANVFNMAPLAAVRWDEGGGGGDLEESGNSEGVECTSYLAGKGCGFTPPPHRVQLVGEKALRKTASTVLCCLVDTLPLTPLPLTLAPPAPPPLPCVQLVGEKALRKTASTVLCCLVDDRIVAAPEGVALLRALNLLMMKTLENGSRTYVVLL